MSAPSSADQMLSALLPAQDRHLLGLAREVNCSGSVHRLADGDGVLLYTDGLIEARGEETRYGIERLSTLLRQSAQLAPQETLERLKRDLRTFAGERLTDDVGLLVLQV